MSEELSGWRLLLWMIAPRWMTRRKLRKALADMAKEAPSA